LKEPRSNSKGEKREKSGLVRRCRMSITVRRLSDIYLELTHAIFDSSTPIIVLYLNSSPVVLIQHHLQPPDHESGKTGIITTGPDLHPASVHRSFPHWTTAVYIFILVPTSISPLGQLQTTSRPTKTQSLDTRAITTETILI
jgi:hypothetical protein